MAIQMRKIRAEKEVYYASRNRKVGEEFEAVDQEARLLVGLGKASYVTTGTPPLQTRQMKAQEPVKAEEPKPSAEVMTTDDNPTVRPNRQRRYRRRDMVPE